MRIDFVVDGTAASFERDSFTGRAALHLGTHSVTLQSPWNPLTHFSLSTTRKWRANLDGHEFIVTKRRPKILGGLRTADYHIAVDGAPIEPRRGY